MEGVEEAEEDDAAPYSDSLGENTVHIVHVSDVDAVAVVGDVDFFSPLIDDCD